jgi:hypothetical protein
VLIAFLATGVSANFRKFAGVGFGIPSPRFPIVSTEGSATVFRLSAPAAFSCVVMVSEERGDPSAFAAEPSCVSAFAVMVSGDGAAIAVEPPLRPPKIFPNFSPILISTPLCRNFVQ